MAVFLKKLMEGGYENSIEAFTSSSKLPPIEKNNLNRHSIGKLHFAPECECTSD